MNEVRQVIAVTRFSGGPGRELEAAEAWAFELTYYFHRAVSEAPQVSYSDGVYTCTGLMQTTHPWDPPEGGICIFDKDSPPWSLDFAVNPARQQHLRKLYDSWNGMKFDGRLEVPAGRDHGVEPGGQQDDQPERDPDT